MALPVKIEDLLNRKKIESNHIEFKKGWNPTDIYRTIGAFANDFDNLGGGYILVGVEETHGVAKRPVTGIQPEAVDGILIPTIQEELIKNGTPRAIIETNDNRDFINLFVPVHDGCGDVVELNVTKDVTKDVVKDVAKEPSERQQIIIDLICKEPFFTAHDMSQKTGVTTRTIQRDIEKLVAMGLLKREGGRKDGKWIVLSQQSKTK